MVLPTALQHAPRGPVGEAERARLAVHTKITHMTKDRQRLLLGLNKSIAEDSLLEYSKIMWSILEPGRDMKVGWAVEAICEHLEAVSKGHIKKLLINVPPGMMKSLLTQVFWPSWEWGPRNQPHLRYVSAAYSESLTIRDNRRARQLIASELYQSLWGDRFAISADQDAKQRYDNDKRGFRIATTIGGLGTGERGDRFIIDDPHNVKTAESDARLDEVAQWFTEVVPSRVNELDGPNASAFVCIMQRVHERDVSGLILSADLGYTHLELPMEYEPSRKCYTSIGFSDPRTEEGELLFPERFGPQGVADLKKQLSAWGGDYAVAGQLQQRPAPRGGGMFKRDACGELLEHAPECVRWLRGWDIAGSKRKTSPYTASVKLGVTKAGTYVIADVTRDRKEIEEAEARIVEVAHDDGPFVKQSLPQDPGSAGKSQKAHMGKALDGLDFEITPESGDKQTRAIGPAAQWNNGNVRLVKGPWNDAFLNELATFPRGAYKDQVDAFSRAYGYMVARPDERPPEGAREASGASDIDHDVDDEVFEGDERREGW